MLRVLLGAGMTIAKIPMPFINGSAGGNALIGEPKVEGEAAHGVGGYKIGNRVGIYGYEILPGNGIGAGRILYNQLYRVGARQEVYSRRMLKQ